MRGRHCEQAWSRRVVLGGAMGVTGVALAGRGASAQGDDEHRRSFPQWVAYPGQAIRPGLWTDDELEADVRRAYDGWAERYLVVGEDVGLARVAFADPGDADHDVTVSEGQGYGMLLLATMAGHAPAARRTFDGLWRFHRENRSRIDERLMAWRVPTDAEDRDSAFDGDCDAAYALLLANAQWGSDGEVDYAAAARRLLDGILASTIGPTSHLPLLGDWVDVGEDPALERSVRPSDFVVGHFRAFARATGDPAWEAVVQACQTAISDLQRTASPKTGLLPDFVQPALDGGDGVRPADPDFLEGPDDGAYAWNAGRTPWRIGVDALVSGDETSRDQSGRMSVWAAEATDGDPLALREGYRLDGRPMDDDSTFSSFFAAPLGVAAMTQADQQAWLDAVYAAVRDRQEGYYQDSVALLCLLVMAGAWWDPTVG